MKSSKKQKSLLRVKVLRSLLGIVIFVIHQASLAQEQTIIRNSSGTFVLVPEKTYIQKELDLFKGEQYKSDFDKCVLEKQEIIPETSSAPMAFASGVAIGLVTALLLKK